MRVVTKLVVNIGAMPRLQTGRETIIQCRLPEQLQRDELVGSEVLLASAPSGDAVQEYFARGVLRTIDDGADGVSTIQIVQIQHFPSAIEAAFGDGGDLAVEIADDAFDGIVSDAHILPPGLGEFTQGFLDAADVYAQINRQLAETERGICCFSGVRVQPGEGNATTIMPTQAGGQMHVSNFLFLHDEPAALFTQFAWTVGPEFEIIADSWRVGNEVLSTLSPSGKIVVGAQRGTRPDDAALAWHREQFFQRLR